MWSFFCGPLPYVSSFSCGNRNFHPSQGQLLTCVMLFCFIRHVYNWNTTQICPLPRKGQLAAASSKFYFFLDAKWWQLSIEIQFSSFMWNYYSLSRYWSWTYVSIKLYYAEWIQKWEIYSACRKLTILHLAMINPQKLCQVT